MKNKNAYWFPAKTYGWGWGLPLTWQGWLVLAAYGVLIVMGILLFPPATERITFLLYITALSVGLVIVCWLKGEPPRWQWGRHD